MNNVLGSTEDIGDLFCTNVGVFHLLIFCLLYIIHLHCVYRPIMPSVPPDFNKIIIYKTDHQSGIALKNKQVVQCCRQSVIKAKLNDANLKDSTLFMILQLQERICQ